jgi:hypothetical protein
MDRTEGLEFSDVVGIRCECANCSEHYTVDRIEPGLDMNDLIRCPRCTGLPADRPLPVKMNHEQLELVTDALVSLLAIHRLAAKQSSEPKPKFKLSFDVRSKA